MAGCDEYDFDKYFEANMTEEEKKEKNKKNKKKELDKEEEEEEDMDELFNKFKSVKLKKNPSQSDLIKEILKKNWPQHPYNKNVQLIGNVFFEDFEKALKNYKHFKDQCAVQATLMRRVSVNEEGVTIGFSPDDMNLDQEDLENLYLEAIFTIKHRIGKTSGGHVEQINDLIGYVKDAFGFDERKHQQMLKRSVDSKPPIVVLEVLVAEAKDLEAKDADGFSDPYCMLGIVQTSTKSAWKSVMKSQNSTTSATVSDIIPAKYIKTTSVKFNTLQPVWDEKFRFDLDDLKTDILHLDVWDRDDDFSVMDSAKRLNQVKSIKGLGRFFKQVAQSARASQDENLDDFMGTIEVKLSDIPSTGLNKWFKLGSRSTRSRVQGHIRLELRLSTREDKGFGDEDEELTEVREHKNLMNIFTRYECRLAKESASLWNGEISKAGQTVLHQHAIQGDISPQRQAVCWWLAITYQFCKNVLVGEILIRSLEFLEKNLKQNGLYQEDMECLTSSFEHCLHYILSLIDQKFQLTTDLPIDLSSIKQSLNLLVRIFSSGAFERSCPFHSSLKSLVIDLIKRIYVSSYKHLRRTKNISAEEDDLIKRYTHTLRNLSMTIIVAKEVYNPLFLEIIEVDVYRVAYKETYKLLNKDLPKDLEELLLSKEDIERVQFNSQEDGCIPVFRLFLIIRKFFNMTRLLPENDQIKLPPPSFSGCFKPYIKHWIDIIDHLLTQRLQLINQLEKVEHIGGDIYQSNLPIDVAYCFGQVFYFWLNLRWDDDVSLNPHQTTAYKFVKIISVGGFEIFDMMMTKVRDVGYYDNQGRFDISEKLCITLNNMEQVRKAYTTASKTFLHEANRHHFYSYHILKLKQQQQFYQQQQITIEHYDEQEKKKKQAIEKLIKSSNVHLKDCIRSLIGVVAEQMRQDIKKFIFKLCWTPESASYQDCIFNLLSYLDSNLETINNFLLKANFYRILEAIWRIVEEEMDAVVDAPSEDLNKAKWVPGRLLKSLGILLDFFHAGGQGLQREVLQNHLYEKINSKLEAMTLSNSRLIDLFYKEKLTLQSKWMDERAGSLTVRTHFNQGSIYVEILYAKNLYPMDINGLSDPFIIVEVGPRYKFKHLKPCETPVAKATLNPVFNQSFVFDVKEEDCHSEEGSLVFILMDHDYLSSNDFAGEAYLSLRDLPGLRGSKGFSGLKKRTSMVALTPISLPFMQGTENTSGKLVAILSALKMRRGDPLVADFLKRKSDTKVQKVD